MKTPNKGGRPKHAPGHALKAIAITLHEWTIEDVDRLRGAAPRAAYIRKALEAHITEQDSANPPHRAARGKGAVRE